MIDAHLKRYGVWVDPREADERQNEEVRAAEVERRAVAERAADAQPATRGDLRRLEDSFTRALSRQDAATTKALAAVLEKAGVR
ncbi:hypothetical protein [Frigoriglobus tundricola]|uniref:hypothetical protein n=1 Tax=Frigoriglobus tundricola TaxID=2774151 RepID=UPI00148EA341|nr:hypothetical protein [Frigoriglobus tundricola]